MSAAQMKMPPPIPNLSASANRITISHELQGRFASDQYNIQQPFFQLTEEGYDIQSVNGAESFRAVRPRHIFRSLIAMFGALGAGAVVFFAGILLFVGKSSGTDAKAGNPLLIMLGMFFATALAAVAFVIVAKFLAPKRRATLFDAAKKPLFCIEPTSSFFLFNSEYMIQDTYGKSLATFRKNYIDSLFRTKWHCHDSQGKYLFSAVEDSLIMGLLRRYLNLGQFIPLHFIFSKSGGKTFGNFIRRYSIRDKYKLDFNAQTTDGWLMVASSILLDTGEKR